MDLLSQLDSPEQLRKLPREQLKEVSTALRNRILETVSEKGGHLASNLGSVELTVALHYVLDTPMDRLVWDVGHQTYAHKILTGRAHAFPTIRAEGGLSGFTSRSESPYDHFGAGHASTSVSAALGIAEGLRRRGEKRFAVAVVGDGSLTGGLVYEALNNAGHIPARNLLVVLNDNEMSIDANVGALQSFIKTSNRAANPADPFTPGMLFECFGFRYFGPVDGHDVHALVEVLHSIQALGIEQGPYLLHVLTTKGKGYKLAEQLPIQYHGVTPFKREDGLVPKIAKKLNYQDVFAQTAVDLAEKDPQVVAITAAMPSGTGLVAFQKRFPDRFYDVGIAEGHAVLFAAGLATEGFRPIVAIYSTFLQRAFDQLIHDVGLQNLPVVFALDRAGLVGADGATHQGAFDLAYLRMVPNFVVAAPKDEQELRDLLLTALRTAHPFAVRYPRGEVVGVAPQPARLLPIGKGELLVADAVQPDVCLIGIGVGVQMALSVREYLRGEGIDCAVVNARFAKPLDEGLLSQWLSCSRLVVTLEEGSAAGGFGSAVLELAARLGIQRDILALGIPDRFIEHASPAQQRAACGLDIDSILRLILDRFATATRPATKASRRPNPWVTH